MSATAQGVRSLRLSSGRSAGSDPIPQEEEAGRDVEPMPVHALSKAPESLWRARVEDKVQASAEGWRSDLLPGKIGPDSAKGQPVRWDENDPPFIGDKGLGMGEGVPAQISASGLRSPSKASRPISRTASTPAKPNDAKFWFSKAKAVYSCRPFSPKKKHEAQSPGKKAAALRRTASVASVWPVTKPEEGLMRKQGTCPDISGKLQSSAPLAEQNGKGPAAGIFGRTDDKIKKLALEDLDESSTRHPGHAEMSLEPCKDTNTRRTKEPEPSCRSPEPADSKAAEPAIVSRIESGRNASTSSSNPPLTFFARQSTLRRRSRSVSDVPDSPPLVARPFIKDGESLLGDLSEVFVTLQPLRFSKGSAKPSLNLQIDETRDGEQNGTLPGRRRTWSPMPRRQNMKSGASPTPPASPLGRARLKGGRMLRQKSLLGWVILSAQEVPLIFAFEGAKETRVLMKG
jgi:hypothetical protein